MYFSSLYILGKDIQQKSNYIPSIFEIWCQKWQHLKTIIPPQSTFCCMVLSTVKKWARKETSPGLTHDEQNMMNQKQEFTSFLWMYFLQSNFTYPSVFCIGCWEWLLRGRIKPWRNYCCRVIYFEQMCGVGLFKPGNGKKALLLSASKKFLFWQVLRHTAKK